MFEINLCPPRLRCHNHGNKPPGDHHHHLVQQCPSSAGLPGGSQVCRGGGRSLQARALAGPGTYWGQAGHQGGSVVRHRILSNYYSIGIK